jgi:hypothetical protein
LIQVNDSKLPIANKGEEFYFGPHIRRRLDGGGSSSGNRVNEPIHSYGEKIKFYRFKKDVDHNSKELGSLEPPFGTNLFRLIISKKNIQDIVRNILQEFNLKLSVNSIENKFEAV